MNVLRRIAMAIGGTVVVALVIGLAAPKTVHALVSALVTVANTSSNPVPTTDVMRSVAQNVELQCRIVQGGCFFVSPTGNLSAFTVPSGSNLVITDVEILALQGGGLSSFICSTTPAAPERTESWFVPSDGATHQFEFPNGIVIPPGATLSCGSNISGSSSVLFAVMRGYLTAN